MIGRFSLFRRNENERSHTMRILMAAFALLALGGCNMYVIDFENRLPDGAVLAPKPLTPPAPPPPPPTPLEGSADIAHGQHDNPA